MTDNEGRLRLFLDHNVTEAAARAFEAAGHAIRRLRRVLPCAADDNLVAATAITAGEILVTHDKDFKRLIKNTGTARRNFGKLNLIKLSCTEVHAAERLTAAMSLIEHEWRYTQARGTRLLIEISTAVIRIQR